MKRRLGVVALVAAVVAGVAVSSAHAALFFLFKPTTANAGDLVTVRLGGTPANVEPEGAERPFRNGIRVYLVPSAVAGEVGSRFDRRLHLVGRLVPGMRAVQPRRLVRRPDHSAGLALSTVDGP